MGTKTSDDPHRLVSKIKRDLNEEVNERNKLLIPYETYSAGQSETNQGQEYRNLLLPSATTAAAPIVSQNTRNEIQENNQQQITLHPTTIVGLYKPTLSLPTPTIRTSTPHVANIEAPKYFYQPLVSLPVVTQHKTSQIQTEPQRLIKISEFPKGKITGPHVINIIPFVPRVQSPFYSSGVKHQALIPNLNSHRSHSVNPLKLFKINSDGLIHGTQIYAAGNNQRRPPSTGMYDLQSGISESHKHLRQKPVQSINFTTDTKNLVPHTSYRHSGSSVHQGVDPSTRTQQDAPSSSVLGRLPRLRVPQESEIRFVIDVQALQSAEDEFKKMMSPAKIRNEEHPPRADNFLSILKETNKLPKNLTPDNIDHGIKTLSFILQRLQQQQKAIPSNETAFSTHISTGSATKGFLNFINEKFSGDAATAKKSQSFPQSSGTSTPGKPGIDYPTYSSIPQTKFDCSTQRYKGFFGDPETKCQVWHYCDLNGGQASFLCPNGTIFSQVALTCDWWFNVKCASTSQLYVLNERLYKYILPFSPSFPEDYSGPVVDRYLTAKFNEMERKSKIKALKSLTSTTTMSTTNHHLSSAVTDPTPKINSQEHHVIL
ncbi:hypothetical protein RUM43_003809 [Polyplax serrata]|uniref:Chitin-binding type-2 domain-containing protein n=1 Tax=Polyplax serrata TaxID=468196 RepID=A0AAN8Q1R2_POLSC